MTWLSEDTLSNLPHGPSGCSAQEFALSHCLTVSATAHLGMRTELPIEWGAYIAEHFVRVAIDLVIDILLQTASAFVQYFSI
jgi:hypothetical protein